MVRTARHVLVVDDLDARAERLCQILSEMPQIECLIDRSSSFDHGLSALTRGTHDLVLLGLDEQRTGASTFIQETRRLGCATPILVVSDQESSAAAADAIIAGAADYVTLLQLDAADLERTIVRILARRQVDLEIQERLAFDKLITKLSMRFINLPPEEVSAQMHGALRLLGEHIRADHSFISLRLDPSEQRETFEWYDTDISSELKISFSPPLDTYSWYASELRSTGAVLVSDLTNIAPHQKEIAPLLRAHALSALIVVPLLCRGNTLGSLGFCARNSRTAWDRDTVYLLRIAGEILANALEQRRVHRDLMTSERRYRSVVEGLGEGILYCDRADRILESNSRLAQLTGYSLEEMRGRTADELLLPPEERHLLQEHTAKRLEGIAEQYEIRLRRKDGSRFWARINATPIYDDQGQIIATLGAVTDVSAQKTASEALLQSEEKYRDLVETSSDLIWSVDLSGKLTFVNSACRAIYGRSPHEVIGRTFSEFVAPHCKEKDLQIFHDILSGKEVYQAETEHCRADGTFVTLAINAIPIRGPNKEIIGATGTASDITRRKQIENELRSQREFFRQVIDAAPSLILVKDHNFRFTLVNQAFAAGYGMTPEQIIGKTDHDIHPNAAEAAEFVEECREVLQTMKPQVLEERAITDALSGGVRWHYTIRKPLVLPDGRPPQVLTVATDISSRKNAEEEALRLEKQLLQAQKMEAIGQLAAGIAHDLNNALGAVVGHLQLLQLSQDLSPSISNSLEIALGGCERALSLIEQLLGFSRQGKYNLEHHSFRKIVSDTVSFLSKVIEKAITIRFQGEEHDSVVPVDAGQLQQALTNLIINAKQAMPHGGTITFTFSEQYIADPTPFNPKATPGQFATLAVQDTGMGIDPAFKDKIFEPFFTTKSVSRGLESGPKAQGTGLGLAMVYGIMQSHGGWVDVQSELGQGACFRLFLPQVRSGDIRMDKSHDNLKSPLGNSSGTVLVVDDEPILVDLTRKFLELAGISSVGFTEGEEAVRWYKEHYQSIDLIVLDMKMAKMDGPACFAELRSINPKAKVAILSGYVQDQAAQDLLQNGALRFFQKPLKYPELVRWISSELAVVRA